jgi:Trk-type K+ transport system membrane component
MCAFAAGRTTQTTNTVGSQAQNFFVKHFVFVFLAILFISMIEEIPLAVDPNYSLFKVIFEVVSAYG